MLDREGKKGVGLSGVRTTKKKEQGLWSEASTQGSETEFRKETHVLLASHRHCEWRHGRGYLKPFVVSFSNWPTKQYPEGEATNWVTLYVKLCCGALHPI